MITRHSKSKAPEQRQVSLLQPGFGDIEQIHNQMMARSNDMFGEMDRMHKQMMRGFGGSFFDDSDFGFGG